MTDPSYRNNPPAGPVTLRALGQPARLALAPASARARSWRALLALLDGEASTYAWPSLRPPREVSSLVAERASHPPMGQVARPAVSAEQGGDVGVRGHLVSWYRWWQRELVRQAQGRAGFNLGIDWGDPATPVILNGLPEAPIRFDLPVSRDGLAQVGIRLIPPEAALTNCVPDAASNQLRMWASLVRLAGIGVTPF